MEFFGQVDKSNDGTVASEYPAWMFTKQIEDLKENIDQIDRSIKSGKIPQSEIPDHRMRQQIFKERLDAIEGSQPKPSDNEKNMLYKFYKSFGSKIQDTMFTLSDMKRGFADAHEEAKRMTQPIIELTPEEAGFVKTCNVSVHVVGNKNMVTRNGLSKAFKMIGKIINEPTNIEVLRKDKVTEAFIPSEISRVKPLEDHHKEGTSLETLRKEIKEEVKKELMEEMKPRTGRKKVA